VYQTIHQVGNKGIWTKDIRYHSNLPHPKLQKILKSLEGRQLVKTVKCSASATKKIYMLFGLKPSEDLTGGQWCAPGAADRGHSWSEPFKMAACPGTFRGASLHFVGSHPQQAVLKT
jgi:hypothetical protein